MFSTWFLFILFSLASFRLTRLLVFDKITDFVRKPFHEEIEYLEDDGTTSIYLKIKGTGLKYWIGELISCYWCTGVWISAILYFSWYFWPALTEPIIIIFAIGGLAGVIETIVIRLIK